MPSFSKLHPPNRLIKGLYAFGLGPVIGHFLLLLTTTGRRTGQSRVTPLQYEEIDGDLYVAAAQGTKADWFQNIVANPHVQVRAKARHLCGYAEPIVDQKRIADFLELRLKRHPAMIGAIFRSEGLAAQPSRCELEEYAAHLALVIIHPEARTLGA